MAPAAEQVPEAARLHHRLCDERGRVTVQWMTRQRAVQEPDGTITPGVSTWHCSTLSRPNPNVREELDPTGPVQALRRWLRRIQVGELEYRPVLAGHLAELPPSCDLAPDIGVLLGGGVVGDPDGLTVPGLIPGRSLARAIAVCHRSLSLAGRATREGERPQRDGSAGTSATAKASRSATSLVASAALAAIRTDADHASALDALERLLAARGERLARAG